MFSSPVIFSVHATYASFCFSLRSRLKAVSFSTCLWITLSSSALNSLTASSAEAIRPAAFMCGAMPKAMFSDVIQSSDMADASSASDLLLLELILFSPYFTIVRFSSVRLTMSPTVPTAARSRTSVITFFGSPVLFCTA